MANDLSQRDLLIKLSTQLEELKLYTKDKFDELDDRLSGLSQIKTDVARLDERVKENSGFRLWVYGALATSILSTILALVGLQK